MKVAAFDYDLPEALIAQEPARERTDARLFVPGAAKPHRTIADLPQILPDCALVVVNDTRVIPARLLGKKQGTGGKAEIFLLERMTPGDSSRWRALGRASKGMAPGTVVVVGELVARVIDAAGSILTVTLETTDGSDIARAIDAHGRVPLPPYIRRDDTSADERDRDRYQTMFAKHDGAVAAPTAGLHLTPALADAMRARGIEFAEVTLHVGLGTFQPVTADDLDAHAMHEEWFRVSEETAAKIRAARTEGRKIVAIGTTTVRALESARDPENIAIVRATEGRTRLLIQPGYTFGPVDMLLTNFHLPKSTLLALVCAFGGMERVLAAYREAVAQRYRFFSYGDAMLLTRAEIA